MSEPGSATVADDGRTLRLVLFSARGADLAAVELSAEAAVRLAGKLNRGGGAADATGTSRRRVKLTPTSDARPSIDAPGDRREDGGGAENAVL